MRSNATSTAWIDPRQRKGRQGEEDDRSRAVHTGPGQRGARYKRTERSGRSFSSANCATRRKRSGRRLPTRRICASGRPSMPMGTWVRLEHGEAHDGGQRRTVAETRVTRADAPKVLEYTGGHDMRWELEAFGGGTRLTLWHNIDRRFISMGAAGWHICFRCSGSPSQRNSHRPHRWRRRDEVRRLAAAERGVRQAVRY